MLEKIWALPKDAFAADTIVAMADGTHKAFSELQSGDKVLANEHGELVFCYDGGRCMRDECPRCRGCCGCDGCGFDCGCLCS